MFMMAGLMAMLLTGAMTGLSLASTSQDDEDDPALNKWGGHPGQGDDTDDIALRPDIAPIGAPGTGAPYQHVHDDDDMIDTDEQTPPVPAGRHIEGGEGIDLLEGDVGDDEVIGHGGGDLLSGGIGNDRIAGGGGNDTLRGDDGATSGPDGRDTLDGGDGEDEIAGQGNDDMLQGGAGNDRLFGGDGNDRIDGGDGTDELNGGEGNDTLTAGHGDNDDLSGNGGDDVLTGNFRADRAWLHGGRGADTVTGGAGDWVEGNEGADLLRIHHGDANTVIADFDPAEDRLHLVIENRPGYAPQVSLAAEGQDALVTLDGAIVARIAGGADLTLDHLVLERVAAR